MKMKRFYFHYTQWLMVQKYVTEITLNALRQVSICICPQSRFESIAATAACVDTNQAKARISESQINKHWRGPVQLMVNRGLSLCCDSLHTHQYILLPDGIWEYFLLFYTQKMQKYDLNVHLTIQHPCDLTKLYVFMELCNTNLPHNIEILISIFYLFSWTEILFLNQCTANK